MKTLFLMVEDCKNEMGTLYWHNEFLPVQCHISVYYGIIMVAVEGMIILG